MTDKATAQPATGAGTTSLSRQFVSDPIAAQTLAAGTVKGTIRALESAVNDNIDVVPMAIYVFSGDGSTLRGTILTKGNYGPVGEFNNSLRAKRSADGDATSQVVALAGDRVVIEIGFGNTTAGTSITGTLNFGDDSATDLGDNETDTAANNPFVELSITVVFPADAYRDAILAESGLVAYWRLGENAGATAADLKSTNHGTYAGTGTLGVIGVIGYDLAFGANANGYVTVPKVAAIDLGNGPFTYEIWVNFTALPNVTHTTTTIWGKDLDADGAFRAYWSDSALLEVFKGGGGGTIARTNIDITLGWHHVVITKNGTTTKIYQDGVDATNPVADQTLNVGTSILVIGSLNGVFTFNGTIDEAAIYNVALSAAQALNHYNLGISYFDRTRASLQAVNRASTY